MFFGLDIDLLLLTLGKNISRLKIQRTFIRQHKHVDKHLNKLGNITVHEY